ncbi:MAG: dGTP triphosphohydrolase [Planctomycetota bacterium]
MASVLPEIQLPDESLWLAPHAMHAADSMGRVHPEPSHPYRTPFQRDRDRIVHSSAYRRLAHKTQVFTGERGDYHRTRLTHTLEVASIARTIGRVLRLNEDLIEALALMHDIGHPPFGHAGEDVLNECAKDVGGFDHNSHAVRIVTQLEKRYPDFPGLNLSREVLSAQTIRSREPSRSNERPLLEAQVVDAADSIAYDSHDADDALELGLLEWGELLEVPLWRDALTCLKSRYTALDQQQLRRAVIHRLIEVMVSDLIACSGQRIASLDPSADVYLSSGGNRLIGVSAELQEQMSQLEIFLFERVYRHPTVLAERAVAGDALREMFARYSEYPHRLPKLWLQRLPTEGVQRTVCDYLAAMTDRYALDAYRRPAANV